jgi:hypothetical protein
LCIDLGLPVVIELRRRLLPEAIQAHV